MVSLSPSPLPRFRLSFACVRIHGMGARYLDDHPMVPLWCGGCCLLVMLAAGEGDGRWWHLHAAVLPIEYSHPTRPLATRPPGYHPSTLFAAARRTQITFLPLSVLSREDQTETGLEFCEFFHGWRGRQHGTEAWTELEDRDS